MLRNKKEPFETTKMENFHKAEIPKWLIHDFNPKFQNFSLFVFPQNNLKNRVS